VNVNFLKKEKRSLYWRKVKKKKGIKKREERLVDADQAKTFLPISKQIVPFPPLQIKD